MASVRKRVLLAALATVLLGAAFIRLDGLQALRDLLRKPEVLRTFELEKTACLANLGSRRPIYFWKHGEFAATIRELRSKSVV